VTATISLTAGSQPESMIAVAARLATSLASLEAQTLAQREALAQRPRLSPTQVCNFRGIPRASL